MYELNNDKMLPNIFEETKDVFEKVVNDLDSFKESLMLDNEQAKVKAFFEEYSKYQTNGLQIFKTAMGDFCVGLKALGNKFGSLGGSSFELLANTSESVISATGEFINFVNNFVISSQQIMEENQQNVEMFNDLHSNVENYFKKLLALLQDLSTATMHLYGDAKNRLQDNFANVEKSLVNFIHMAKIKIVSALAISMVGIELGYNHFTKLTEIKLQGMYNDSLLTEQGDVDKLKVKEFLKTLVVNFEEVETQTQKMFD